MHLVCFGIKSCLEIEFIFDGVANRVVQQAIEPFYHKRNPQPRQLNGISLPLGIMGI